MKCLLLQEGDKCPFKSRDCWDCEYFNPDRSLWEIALERVRQLPQAQDSLTDQIQRALVILNKFGLNDVADYLRPKEKGK